MWPNGTDNQIYEIPNRKSTFDSIQVNSDNVTVFLSIMQKFQINVEILSTLEIKHTYVICTLTADTCTGYRSSSSLEKKYYIIWNK